MELSEFLAARLADDEAIVETIRSGGFPAPTWTTEPAKGGHWEILREADDPTPLGYVTHGRGEHLHIALHDPARVLAEVAAKRAILAEHRQGDGDSVFCWRCDPGSDMGYGANYPCCTIRHLAAVYSGHPDYDPAWAPEGATQTAPKSRSAVICGPVLPAPSLAPPDGEQEQRPHDGEHGGRHSEKPI